METKVHLTPESWLFYSYLPFPKMTYINMLLILCSVVSDDTKGMRLVTASPGLKLLAGPEV